MRVGALYAVLRLETAQFDAALGKAQTKMGAFMGIMRAAAWMGAQAFAAVLGASLYVAQDFEKHMTASLAIMGDVTQSQRARMEEAARSIAKVTTFSANDAADAYFYLAGAGYDAEQSISALPVVARFAAAGNMDLEKSTELLMNAQTSMNLKVDDATQNMENMTRVSDVLTAAQIESTATLEQMSEALINKAAPALRLVNKDIEEGAAVLMVMANQGVKGRAAGTGLAIVLRELQTKAIKNKDAWKELGVAAFDAEGNMRNMADIVGDLEGVLGGMSDEQQRVILGQLGFTDRSMGFIQALLGQSEAIRGYEEDLRSAGGTTETVAQKQLDNFNAQMTIMWHKIVDVGISIGQKLLPGARDMVEAIGNWFDANHELIVSIVTGLAGAIGWLIGTAIKNLMTAIGAVADFITWFKDTPLGELIESFVRLFTGQKMFEDDFLGFWLQIKEVFAPIVGFIQAVVNNFDQLEGYAGDDSAMGVLGEAVVFLNEAFAWLVENILPMLQEGFRVLVEEIIPAFIAGLMWVIDEVIPVLIAVFNMVIDEVIPRLVDAFTWVYQEIFPAVGEAIRWVAEEVVPVLAAVFAHLADWVVDNMPLIQAIIGQVMGAVSTAFQVAWEIIKFIWTAFGQHIWAGAKMFGSVAIPVITGAISFLLETFKFVFDAIGKIWQAFADAGEIVVRAVKGVFRGLGRFFGDVWDGIGGAFRTGLNVVVDLLNGFIGFLNGFKLSIPEIDLGPMGKYGGGSIDPFNLGYIPRFASGVRGFGGGLAMVGENGPELAYLPRGTNVYSNSETMAMMNGDVTVTIRDPDGAIARGGLSQHQLERAISDGLKELVGGARHRSLRVGSD